MSRNQPGATIAAVAAVLALWTCASIAAERAPLRVGEEATIPQARKRIMNWVLNGQSGVWVQTSEGQWYYGEFLGPCVSAKTPDSIAFRFNHDGSLNRFSRVVGRARQSHLSCAFRSFLVSAGPPRGAPGGGKNPVLR